MLEVLHDGCDGGDHPSEKEELWLVCGGWCHVGHRIGLPGRKCPWWVVCGSVYTVDGVGVEPELSSKSSVRRVVMETRQVGKRFGEMAA